LFNLFSEEHVLGSFSKIFDQHESFA